MDIAIDANDDSRRAMPGEAYLMLRARCSKATFYRRMEALVNAGLLKVVRRAAPGTRAVYEILPLLTGLSVSETRSVDNPPPLRYLAFETGLRICSKRVSRAPCGKPLIHRVWPGRTMEMSANVR